MIKLVFSVLIFLILGFKKKDYNETKKETYIESIVAYEVNNDSIRLSYWGQNDFALNTQGFWKTDENKNILYQEGYYCFDNDQFLKLDCDTIFCPKDYKFYFLKDSVLNRIDSSLQEKVLKNYSNDHRSSAILRELNSQKTRNQTFARYTHVPIAEKDNLSQEYYLFKVRMKVRRLEQFDFERCVFNKNAIFNFFRVKKIPFYQVLSIEFI